MEFMKILRKTTALFVFSCVFIGTNALANTENSVLTLLNQMRQAEDSLSYERFFLQITPANIESLRYRHTKVNGIAYAQLINLDGSQQEILQRGNLVAYFNSNFQPFTIQSNQIVESLPIGLRANFEQLSRYYDFVDGGRNRVANRIVQTVKLLPKDNFRYQYVLFIDEEHHLLLRSDLLDRDGQLLEQFRTVNVQISDELTQLAEHFDHFRFPPLIVADSKTEDKKAKQNWQASWLPPGFKCIKSENDDYENTVIESQLYSDGLFSFTLYISPSELPDNYENSWKQGVHTIYSETLNGREITLIGQLPLTTAKRIVQDIKFN
ncbi:MucB/RseB-like sigma(E) regulatory protein [Cricetibacter osteomyelitidis]|uniref:MucB/RseB-like sigma(E) regulatory protein n=1 Tax=Cricetibacter osteomyelitidis TaxID=1521931 RepID=A0A4V2T0C2_9PAST|nr:sigma-E factor regulatory protein RseB [Cricetibacter osteomyelitidis]TCP88803.1 MucB/RseB-like sigma(E) regulatory protein [Cricetibacter osteomyelitidis]